MRGLQELIEADGGAFEFLGFDPAEGVVRLRLLLDHVTCPECILPPAMLRQVASEYLCRSGLGVAVVEVDDPRESGLRS